MSIAGVHERIYAALRGDFLAGVFRPSVKLNLGGYARRHDTSMTPVREAAFRLVGEQLLEPHPDNGFRIYLPDALRLLQLYAWNGQHLLAALHMTSTAALHAALAPFRAQTRAWEPITSETDRIALVHATGDLFRAIGSASGNVEFVHCIEAANARLLYLRLAETRVFKDSARELSRLIKGGDLDVENNVRRRILAYHRRRIEQASQILAAALT